MNVIVSQDIEQACPTFVGACVEASVRNTPYCAALWEEIEALGERYRSFLTTDTVKELSGIAATRRVYRACGKDPSRYRPASEALIRRQLQGKALYQISSFSRHLFLPRLHENVPINGILVQIRDLTKLFSVFPFHAHGFLYNFADIISYH